MGTCAEILRSEFAGIQSETLILRDVRMEWNKLPVEHFAASDGHLEAVSVKTRVEQQPEKRSLTREIWDEDQIVTPGQRRSLDRLVALGRSKVRRG